MKHTASPASKPTATGRRFKTIRTADRQFISGLSRPAIADPQEGTLLVVLLIVIALGFLYLGVELSAQRRAIEQINSHLRAFDGGVAQSFDRVDDSLARVEQRTKALTAPRCEFGGCKRFATSKVSFGDRDVVHFTCVEHDLWINDAFAHHTPLATFDLT
jgi:hypothetical protein